MRDLLTEFVDERTPQEAPPFEYVEQAARERRRRKYVVSAAIATVVVVAGGAAVIGRPSAAPGPSGPTPAITAVAPNPLDEGAPPEQFKIGSTLMLLRGEIAVTAVTLDPASPSRLVVNVERDEIASSRAYRTRSSGSSPRTTPRSGWRRTATASRRTSTKDTSARATPWRRPVSGSTCADRWAAGPCTPEAPATEPS